MAEFQYKAFISYSHSDVAWATWLHKALESYRLPRKLVGTEGRYGAIPAKLFPVFRDRDELSSASDLSERVQAALRDSASLVVVCSPAAAASRWVNEEIRTFRALGRSDRIFSIIVDGDPQATRMEDACFPPALLEGVAETHEPLAADPRKWADGKLLAKLKLVSGILGIRLDELRQREQRRRRIHKAGYAATGILILALVMVAAISSIERKAQQENAEQLVSELVEISKSLDSKVDLETQRALGERLQSYLEKIDPADLTPGSRKQVAQVLRQMGIVAKAQGRLDDAMKTYSRSRDIFSGLAEEFPSSLDLLYELGNAEFYVADAHVERFEYAQAEDAFLKYRDIAKQLTFAEPMNAAWFVELSNANMNLAALAELQGGPDRRVALEYSEKGAEYLARAMELEPDNKQHQNQYPRTLAWLADAQLGVCDLEGAWRSRVAGTALARAMSEEAPGNRAHKQELAYALTGAAKVQRYRGEPDVALEQLGEAQALLDELYALDPSNIKLKWESTRRAALIAALHSDLGHQATALPAMAAIRDEFDGILSHNEDEYLHRTSQFGQFLLDYSQAARRDGDPERAARLLDAAVEMLSAARSGHAQDRTNTNAMRMAEFRRWELHGAAPAEMTGQDPQGETETDFEAIGCLEANLSAHEAILRGNRALAERYTTYLLESGFRDPGFVMFCKEYELCDL